MPTLAHTSATAVSDGGRLESARALKWQDSRPALLLPLSDPG